MTNEFRFTVIDDLHRILIIDAAVRGIRAKKLATEAVLELVEQGIPDGGIPAAAIPAGRRPVLTRFNPDEAVRVRTFAGRHNVSVSQIARIALATKYADELAKRQAHNG